MDPTASDADREDYNQEFKALTSELEDLMKSKFHGRNLFSPTMLGKAKRYLYRMHLIYQSSNKNGATMSLF